MRIKEQFKKCAKSYEEYSKIQQFGVKALVDEIKVAPKSIIDLGCGSGRVYKELIDKRVEFKEFYGIDFAKEMLSLHPKESRVKLICADFNQDNTFNSLSADILISASALQWAKDINLTMNNCSKVANYGYFFIFTSNTFKSLHKLAEIDSPIYSKERVIKAFCANYKENKIKEFNFKLKYESTIELLRYIQKSGVSGGLNIGYRKMKYILDNYKLNYLEFEALLLTGESLDRY